MRDDHGQRIDRCAQRDASAEALVDDEFDVLSHECLNCGVPESAAGDAYTHCVEEACNEWDRADFANPERGVWPPVLLAHEQWMGHRAKQPFAPWADPDAPALCSKDGHTTAAECDCDARFKWGFEGNYVDGATVAIAEDDPRLDGRVFLQQPDDPFAYVDGDDVRCPETGEVHPAFLAILDRLGLTYADVSQSESGSHAQYVGQLPDGVKEANWQLDDEPWGANNEGDLPSIEIYAGKRVCVMTGKHVPGTPTDVREWDDDALETLLDENGQLPDPDWAERTAGDRAAVDLDDYESVATSADEVTTDIRDVYAALDVADPQWIAERTIVHQWNDNASTSSGARAFYPTWGKDSNGTANIVDDRIWQDTGDEGGYGGPVVLALIGAGELDHRTASPRNVRGRLWWEGIEHLRDLGVEVPAFVPEAGAKNSDGEAIDKTPLWALRNAAVALGVLTTEEFVARESEDGGTYSGFPNAEAFNATLDALDEAGVDHGREHIDNRDESGQQYHPETCAPPTYNPVPFDREQRWRELEGERYNAWLNCERACIWGDGAGAGKTTNAARAAAARDRSHVVLFDKHAKAREFVTNAVTPDEYFHLKGGEQPLYDCCMDATVNADEDDTPECPTHGHPAVWPAMNPIYERKKDDPLREQYEVLVSVVGPRRALFLLDKDGELTEENPWLEQFERLATAERVVGVHEYQTLKTVLEGEQVGERDLILDETPRLLASEHRVSVEALVRVESRLDDLVGMFGRDDPITQNFHELARFSARVRDAIVGDEPGALGDIEPPELVFDAYETYDDMAGHIVEYVLPEEDWQVGEAAAQAKLAYNEATIRRVQDSEWNGEPFCVDQLLAAAAKAGLPDEALRRAIAVPPVLEHCPWCASDLGYDNGARCCPECGWDERKNTITTENGEPARATAWFDDDPADLDRDGRPALAFKQLPLTSDLPDPLVLDATATPEKVAGLYGREVSEVAVEGDDPLNLDRKLRVTQVVGGQYRDGGRTQVGGQYHASTIKASEAVQRRIQAVIDHACELHERPLFGIRKDLIALFDFPENAEVLHYGGARGLDFEECDAVVCIGAPHPNVDDLRRDAELLVMDRDDLWVGGEEYSTRRNAPNPPIYRKLLYGDENGDGLAVPTKAYSGLVGTLFYEAREKELEQFVHRIRPVLADELKHAYLLTDVPTDLPVNNVVGFEELADPIEALLPVSEGAVRLLRHVLDVQRGDGPDGFRAGELVEQRADGTVANKVKGYHRLAQVCGETGPTGDSITRRTVRNWVADLDGLGLLTPEEFEKHRGKSYIVDIATSKRALQVLSCNGGFEVALKRRLAALAAEVDSGLTWLDRAMELAEVSGDRCEWDPPEALDKSPG